ncbi:MAG: hypothetical protein HXY50_05625 [Ignavibacteriaceae bacterium]|nr:hypothetical protein [Ignavibacteriaceae bacterium]
MVKVKKMFPQISDSEVCLPLINEGKINLLSILPRTKKTPGRFRISINLDIQTSIANVFITVNGEKTDLFYSVCSGKYVFNIYLKKGKNLIGIYYTISGETSSIVHTIINIK